MLVLRRVARDVVTAVIAFLLIGQHMAAAQSVSPSYRAEEAQFGTGGELDTTSTSFRGQSSVGSLAVGRLSGTNYDVEAGFLTPSEPFLEMYVTGATVDFGTFDPSVSSSGAAQAGGCSCSFAVRSYLSSEYVVLTVSDPLTNESGDVFTAKAVQGAPSVDPNVEEFGINLVDNTSPNIGSNPSNYPDDSFADGQVDADYATVNQFKYVVGDIIARSPATVGNPGIGQSFYTISYVAKPSQLTAAGVYVMNHTLVAVPTY